MQSKYGFRPEARHVNYVVEAEARAGNLADAAGLMEASGRQCTHVVAVFPGPAYNHSCERL